MLFGKEKTESLREAVQGCSAAAVVVHTHPDGDALGSGIAMRRYLESKGKKAVLIIPDTLPQTLDFLVEGEPMLLADSRPEEARRAIAGCDALFVLDMNAFRRAEALEPALRGCKAPVRVLIDHHLDPDEAAFTLVFSTPEVSSASELLFWILSSLEGGAEGIPEKARYALMTGMTTDTNNFSNSVFPSTLEMAARLIASGVDRDDITANLYQNYSAARLEAFAALLGRHTEVLPGGVSVTIATSAFQAAHPLRQGETEGLVNIPLQTGSVHMSLFLKQEKGHFRVSIRSKKGWSANRLAAGFFHGGGHEQASGGKVFWPSDIAGPSEIKEYVRRSVARFMQNRKSR